MIKAQPSRFKPRGLQNLRRDWNKNSPEIKAHIPTSLKEKGKATLNFKEHNA